MAVYLPTLKQLQYLVALRDTGHFGRAADACFICLARDIWVIASDTLVPSGASGTASPVCMISRTKPSIAPSLPLGWNARKSNAVNPRLSSSATASTSPSASCINDEVVGARLCGQASRTCGSTNATSAASASALSPLAVMKALNKIGGKHGVGRVDMVENRFVGMKSRGVYETPGGAILHFAHRQMESLTMDREVMHQRDALIPKYAELVYNGFWYAPEREALQAYVEESQKNVTGTVRVKLYKGNIMVSGRKSKVSLYNPHIATMEADPTKAYNQDDATGFIRLNGLRLKVAAKVQRKK